MTGCAACGEQPKNTAKDFTKAVIEINNPEEIILFRKVVIPTSMGDDTAVPAAIGKYRNVLLVYEANNHAYLYSSDGIPTLLTSDVAQELEQEIKAVADDLATETVTRQGADTALGGRIDTVVHDLAAETLARGNADANLQGKITDEKTARENADTALDNRLTAVEGIAATAVQPATVDKTVMTGVSVNSGTTSTIQLDSAKQNILNGATSTSSIVLPVASHNAAGVMNQSTYDAVTNNTNNINAIMNGAVAVSGLSANPTQADITAAWRQETGLTDLINRAGVYDVTNDKVWTYYANDTTWHAASNTTQVTVNTFTNSSEGVIKGSTNAGQVYAENDGTGSVNGWDTLNNTVSGKQDALTAGSNITISSNTISANNDKVAQKKDTSSNGDFPVLIKYNSNNNDETSYVKYKNTFTFNPSTGKVKATSGAVAASDNNLVTGDAVNSAVSAKVNIANINLTGQTTTILAQVQALGGTIDYARFTSTSDGGTANISDLPVAGKGFTCVAYKVRGTSSSDYAYELIYYINDGNSRPYYGRVLHSSSSITWRHLSAVALSGSYNDLSNKPTIPAAQVNSDWNANSGVARILNKPSLATVATSGSYNDLTNKPTIPAAQVNSDWNANSGVARILNKPTLATVATSGSYNDLSNKPTIPAAQVQSNWTQTNASSADYIKNKPSLATVATSGAYSDLTGKPTIPTVNNATLTIQKNGSTVKTFTANASSNVTANITVPTKVSELNNDSGFISSVAWGDVTGKPSFATVATSGSYNDLTNKPTIPAAQIQSDWTQSDNTKKDFIKNKPTIPTVNDSTITVTNNGTSKGTFTTNQASAGTVALDYPAITMQTTDPGEGVALAANNFIAVYNAS